MKTFLILLLLTFSTNSFSFSSNAEINAITVKSGIHPLLERLNIKCAKPLLFSGPPNNQIVTLVLEGCTPKTPTLAELGAELVLYKLAEKAKLAARLAERARVSGLKIRIRDLKDIRLAASLCGYTNSNIKKVLMEKIKSKDNTFIDCLESKDSEININILVAKNRRTKRKQARSFIKGFNCSIINNKFQKAVCELLRN